MPEPDASATRRAEMRNAIIFALGAFLLACSGQQDDRKERTAKTAKVDGAKPQPANETEPAADDAPTKAADPDPLIGESVAVAEWRKAENRTACAPLALASDAGGAGKARPARFSGGWAVAFDQPDLRSAYGFAGPGLIPDDRRLHEENVAALEKQWPYTRRFGPGEKLPNGSFAGYGVEGALGYASSNPDGRGQESLAYLRIPGQLCQYNVWSKLGRAHLEALLENLRIVQAPE